MTPDDARTRARELLHAAAELSTAVAGSERPAARHVAEAQRLLTMAARLLAAAEEFTVATADPPSSGWARSGSSSSRARGSE